MKRTPKTKATATTVLKRSGKTVGYQRWRPGAQGILRCITSITLDGPECGYIPHTNRVQYRTAPKKTTGRLTADKFYTPAEIAKLYTAARQAGGVRGAMTEFILLMLLNTGLRATELCELKVKDTPVSLGVDELSVLGKGNKLRPVPILPELSEKIRRYVKDIRPKFIRRAMKVKDRDQPLLLRENGQPYTRQLLYDRISRLGRIAGLTKQAGVHRCRHTFATHYFRTTQDIVQLCAILGHSNINTTAIYAKPDETAVQQQLRLSADILNGGASG